MLESFFGFPPDALAKLFRQSGSVLSLKPKALQAAEQDTRKADSMPTLCPVSQRIRDQIVHVTVLLDTPTYAATSVMEEAGREFSGSHK